MRSDLESFITKLEERGFHHSDVEERESDYHVSCGAKGENTSITVHLFFDKEDKSLAIRSFSLVHVPESKFADAMFLCNQLNQEYRWVKFSVDKDGDVIVSDDALVSGPESGAMSYELLMRMMSISDSAYAKFMKMLWA